MAFPLETPPPAHQEQLNGQLLEASGRWDLNSLRELIAQGADPRTQKDLALCLDAEQGHLSIVQHLVKQGADVQTEQDYAVRLASSQGHRDLVQYLVEQGADFNVRQGYSLLWAANYGRLAVVQYLIEQGADLDSEWLSTQTAVLSRTQPETLQWLEQVLRARMEHELLMLGGEPPPSKVNRRM